MSKETHVRTIIMGSLKELIRNRQLAYVSETNPQYSHLTDEGREFVLNMVGTVLPMLIVAEKERARNEAEELMINKLSGDSV
jgi:hypothetical protein